MITSCTMVMDVNYGNGHYYGVMYVVVHGPLCLYYLDDYDHAENGNAPMG